MRASTILREKSGSSGLRDISNFNNTVIRHTHSCGALNKRLYGFEGFLSCKKTVMSIDVLTCLATYRYCMLAA